ncbi:dipeptide ABC transporter ATP-binding protein [Brevibacillus choshinensis]|uniref:ABC transporter ATP-binding protein n=1 Tax=Brevibacillus choshinensis TaxID=54911 RepID=UPI002E1EECE2|nr:dipeptide ABC transporter ATP-binding protein [Brevibacillus choshinensis]MED4750370.1 dipeptide ABC transporter ATP-binding protein [Brevibacillus choshinensis]
MTETPLLELTDLKKYYPIRQGLLRKQTGYVKAVDGISFKVFPGETFGLVGESGCGKSTLGRVIVQLMEATAGEIQFGQKNVASMSAKEKQAFRRQVQMIFQDPFSSLNPRQKIGDILEEPYSIHSNHSKQEREEKAAALLRRVGLDPLHAERYPHQFSGGQRQRIGIARALALNPQLIVCDEPVSALDVSIQSQIINLLEELQEESGVSLLFIAHDLSVVKHISRRIAVMYLGSIVELATAEELFLNPQHPYTRTLLSSIPAEHPRLKRERITLVGEIPNPANPPIGCKFHTRCPYVEDICKREVPVLKETSGHAVACHLIK